MPTFSSRRRGFTAIEVLVIAACLATGFALFAPALQEFREQERTAKCKNNLKQIGIGLHNSHETFTTFPPAWTERVTTPGNGARYGWQAFLLPQVDQAPLYDRIDFNKNSPTPDVFLIFHQGDNTMQTHIDVYRCPSDPTSPTNPMRGDFGTSNYSGNHGNLSLPRWTTGRQTAFWPGQMDTPRKSNGIMYWNSKVRIRDITDGLSQTIQAGERCVTSAAGIWPGVGSNDFENDVVTECSHGSRPNHAITSFSSAHEGGVHVLMCDGSVSFLSDSIDSKPNSEGDLGTYQRLANRHDGLPVGEF